MSSNQNFGYIQEKIILSKVRGFSWTVLISIINNLIIYHSYLFIFKKTINFPFKQNEKSIVFWEKKKEIKMNMSVFVWIFHLGKKVSRIWWSRESREVFWLVNFDMYRFVWYSVGFCLRWHYSKSNMSGKCSNLFRDDDFIKFIWHLSMGINI